MLNHSGFYTYFILQIFMLESSQSGNTAGLSNEIWKELCVPDSYVRASPKDKSITFHARFTSKNVRKYGALKGKSPRVFQVLKILG